MDINLIVAEFKDLNTILQIQKEAFSELYNGRKSRQNTITSCALESTIPKRGSGRTAEKHTGA